MRSRVWPRANKSHSYVCSAVYYRDGVIRSGDRVVTVNGVTVITASVEMARRLVKESSSTVHMVIEYDIAVMG